ncbi:MAG: cupin domain-containing protein [Alcanivorax sp.]|nr:cupin domain-containing protein [Alcanivorax sp.]
MKTRYADINAFVTRDDSQIRELMHPDQHARLGAARQSLAEARVAPGARTLRHQHRTSEEIYHITAGNGRMMLGDNTFSVATGDTVCIPPGTPHWLHNTGTDTLVVLCACTPPYRHDDTDLLP